MDSKQEEEEKTVLDGRLQNILNSLSRCKIDFTNENEECKKLREANSKLEVELKEVREMEKSHRYHLLSSREMIANLQETVSQLVYLKRDVKKLKEQISLKETNIADIEKDKETTVQKQNENVMKLRSAYEKQIEELKADSKRESWYHSSSNTQYPTHLYQMQYLVQQMQHECDAQVAQLTCVIEEMRAKMREMEVEHREKMNMVVLENEEKVQREAARATQLQEELARETARTDLNMDAYRRRLEELEEKLKQSQFKQYLQSSYPSQYGNHVERPYSANRELYTFPDHHIINSDPVQDTTNKYPLQLSQNKAPKTTNSLQVIYYDKKDKTKANSSEKKGLFHITKKRKLYNDKDFQDF